MKVGDLVEHKNKKIIGVVREMGRRAVLVDWSDHTGVCFRWAKWIELEVISESR